MANDFLGLLGSALGTTPPSYMEGLLGAQQTEDLRKRSIGTGLVNALIGYAAMPKNQNLGLGRILAGAAQAGIQGAQGVYSGAIEDYQTKAKIDEMQRQKALQERELRKQQEIETLAPQLFKTTAPVYQEVQGQPYNIPRPAAEGAVAPEYGLQQVMPEPTRQLVTPARTELDIGTAQRIAALSKDPLAAYKNIAETIPALRKAGMVQMTGQQDNPFDMFAVGSQSPTVQKLANTYKKSYEAGQIDQDTAEKRIIELGKMDETYANRIKDDAAREASLANTKAYQSASLDIARSNAINAQASRDIALANKAQKVLPPAIAKIESGHIDTAMGNVSLADKLDGVINNVVASKIDLSPIKNTQLATQSALGSTNPDVMLFNQINEFKKQFTNMKLTLNKGTQTEGDAKRAMDEISNARSTPDLIRSLQDLRESYRKLALEENKTAEIKRKNFGVTPEKGYDPFVPVPVPEYRPVVYSDQDQRYKNLPVGSVYINGKTGQAMTKTK